MDPNETLRLLRLTIKQLRVDEDTDVWEAHANEICEYFEELDDWLSRGGFPPEEWREGPDAPDEGEDWPEGYGRHTFEVSPDGPDCDYCGQVAQNTIHNG